MYLKGRIKELYKQGLTYSEIADACEVTRDVVAGHVRRMRLPKRGGRGGWAFRDTATA